MTIVKIVPLIALIVVCLAAKDPDIGISLPQFSDFESVVLLTFYAFMAFLALPEPRQGSAITVKGWRLREPLQRSGEATKAG
jgi:amino acid transporter